MFKKGFTLAEVLVALSIVGVVAAVSAPAITNMMPDSDKLTVLKSYKVLNDATQELINDPGFYINFSDGNCVGLSCTAQPESISIALNNVSGDAKYAHLLAMNINGDNRARGTSNVAVLTFTTNDQIEWQIMKSNDLHFVSIDIDGDGVGRECFYGEDGCTRPDRYQFVVDREGNIRGNDALTSAYLKTRTNVRNRANDINEANNILRTYDLNVRNWISSN